MRVNCTFCSAKFSTPVKTQAECPSCGSTDVRDFIFSENETPDIPQSTLVYEIKYKRDFGNGAEDEHEEATEARLNFLRDNKKGYYSNIEVIKELGMTDTTWLLTWYEKGFNNTWISGAYDPIFSISSFKECKTFDYLVRCLKSGGWSLGTAFYYQNLAFINQSDGGDEWLIIKEDVSFESYSCSAVLNREGGIRKFAEDIWCYLNTPKEKLSSFDYVGNIPEVIEFEGKKY